MRRSVNCWEIFEADSKLYPRLRPLNRIPVSGGILEKNDSSICCIPRVSFSNSVEWWDAVDLRKNLIRIV